MPEEVQTTTPAPVSTPETTSPAPATSQPTPDTSAPVEGGETPADVFAGFDFKDMDFADETGETVVVDRTKTDQAQSAPVQQPTAPVQPPATAAPVAPVQPTAPTAQPVAPTPAPTPQAPPSSGEAGKDPYLVAWEQNAQHLDAELQKYYALDDATAEAILENPKETLPRILSRLHMAVLQNTYKAVLDRLPPLMQNTAQAVRSHQQSEERFYKAWPIFKSDDPTHTQVLLNYAQLYRSQNPGASEADFTKFVGAAAAAHLGLKMPVSKGNGKGKPVPYSPAGSSAPSSGGGEPAPTQFEDMFNVIVGGRE